MNARACTDADVGALLHAYELGGLTEADVTRFEIHLLQCDRCFEAVRVFAPWAELLRTDNEVRGLVHDATKAPEAADSRLSRLGRYLWPPWPLVFRPAMIYLLVLVLLYPAYRGLRHVTTRPVEAIQTITLVPSRSAVVEGAVLQSGRDAAITFVFRGAQPGETYRVRLTTEKGRVVYEEEAFTGFDKYETGQILFPAEHMRPGAYVLELTDPRGNPPQNRQVYNFRIQP
ncbi:MAG: zf-HC2 domain-containing protein [candidate division Zixibacteria bacterium]|nr:zf-HC2 domain-containing protein [candidate division Zixibacteria bacterium]